MKAGIGDTIKILKINYCIPDGDLDTQAKILEGKEGVVTDIDDLGQLHGTWGGLALIPKLDKYEIIKPQKD